jgi:hypothetical protein
MSAERSEAEACFDRLSELSFSSFKYRPLSPLADAAVLE